MALIRLSYQHRLFIALLLFMALFMACFLLFQYDRELKYKAELLNERLQVCNLRMIDALADGIPPDEYVAKHGAPIDDLRITVIDRSGRVVYDNALDSLPSENHLTRPEISQALATGIGFDSRRHSSTTDDTYFYSAMAADSVIVRTAAPYTVTTGEMLRADRSFLGFMLVVAIVLSVIGYVATRRIGRTIARLNRFAAKAERGEPIYGDAPFPHDELGAISGHIVQLYANLRQAMIERDRQHREALRQEQEKTLLKRRLSNNISHELKTPVAAMQVCLETLIDRPELTEEKRREFIARCYDNCRRLQGLLADVSTITRLDDGSAMIETTRLDLTELIRSVAAEFPTTGIPISMSLPERMTIEGNYALMASVFRNLIANANAYSQGTIIEITARRNHSQWIIDFSDNGIGIAEEHHSRLFERFYRIDAGRSRAKGGTGLGLSIVKNAILFHGGTVTVANRPLGGLHFHITLPAGGL